MIVTRTANTPCLTVIPRRLKFSSTEGLLVAERASVEAPRAAGPPSLSRTIQPRLIRWGVFVAPIYIDHTTAVRVEVSRRRSSARTPGSGRSPGEGNGFPPQYSCLENSMDTGAWWATVHGIAKNRARLSDWLFLRTKNISRKSFGKLMILAL